MKYFVTGATGYIGEHLVNSLILDKQDVHALCRSEQKAAILPQKTKIFMGDIMDMESVLKGMKGCEYVIHLAAFAKVWAKDSGKFYDINVRGTNMILEAAHLLGVKRVVVVSTGGVYGPSFGTVINEDYVRKIDFNNEYEGSKALSESWIKDFVIKGLDIVIVSPTRVYGPYLHGNEESVTLLIKKYVKEGWRFIPGPTDRIGNYVFVEDVVDGIRKSLVKGIKGRTYILGGENYSYGEFFKVLSGVSGIKRRMFQIPLAVAYLFAWIQLQLARVFGRDPLITPKWVAKAKYHWEVSSERAEKELDYKITGLKEGLEKTIEELNR